MLKVQKLHLWSTLVIAALPEVEALAVEAEPAAALGVRWNEKQTGWCEPPATGSSKPSPCTS